MVSTAYAAATPVPIVPLTTDITPVNGGITALIISFSNNTLGILFLVAGFIAVLFLVWGGIRYISSNGAPDKAKAALATVVNSIYGIIIIAAAYAIIRFALILAGGFNALVK